MEFWSQMYPLGLVSTAGWVWWHTPVIPATQEAEVGELLEPTRQRLLGEMQVAPHDGQALGLHSWTGALGAMTKGSDVSYSTLEISEYCYGSGPGEELGRRGR